MGGLIKKPVIGERIKLGVVAVPWLRADALLMFKFDKKIVGRGFHTGGVIGINEPELYGGKKKEGGIGGHIEYNPGGPTQAKSPYLTRVIGPRISAFRGFATLVFRQFWWGNSPYLKPWGCKPLAIACHGGNWYPEKAYINPSVTITKGSIYLALDCSSSMLGERMEAQVEAVSRFLNSLKGSRNDIKIVLWSITVIGSIQALDCSDDDYDDLIDWLEANAAASTSGTNFAAAVSEAADFFSASNNDGSFLDAALNVFGGLQIGTPRKQRRKIVVFLTDGAPNDPATATAARATLDAIGGVETFAINIIETDTTYTEVLDNTPVDGVPVVSASASDINLAIGRAFMDHCDMNPAHILRDAEIDPDSGGSGDYSEIDDDDYRAAADRLYDEGFGLTFFWNTNDRDAFISEIERHIDGQTFTDRLTGKKRLKLIRDDYDVDDLPVFTRGMISEWTDGPFFPQYDELPNYLTLKYRKREDGEQASVSLGNTASIILRAQGGAGGVMPKDITYEGIHWEPLAQRVLDRDLAAVTTPRVSGAFRVPYLDPTINMGDAIVVEDPSVKLAATVMRIEEITEGAGDDTSAVIRVSQDKYRLSAVSPLGTIPPAVPESQGEARPATERLVQEAPYLLLVRSAGQADVDDRLASDDATGFVAAAAGSPGSGHIEFTAAVDAGPGWQNGGNESFAPTSVLTTDVAKDPEATEVRLALDYSFDALDEGDLLQVDGEIMRIDTAEIDEDEIVLTVGRACLDTAPALHTMGTRAFVISASLIVETAYLDSEEVAVKLLTRTGSDSLTIRRAPTDTVVMNSRAARPYPPGNLRVNGSYDEDQQPDDPLLTWSHRDRTVQTTGEVEDHTFADIGPEADVSYIVRAEALDDTGGSLGQVIEENVGTDTEYAYDTGTVLPEGTDRLVFRVWSVRDGLESWQAPSIRVVVSQGGWGLNWGYYWGGT